MKTFVSNISVLLIFDDKDEIGTNRKDAIWIISTQVGSFYASVGKFTILSSSYISGSKLI